MDASGTPPAAGNITTEGCRGFALNVELPADWVDAYVPDAFGPASTIPFLATVGAWGFRCRIVTAGSVSFEDVGILWTRAGALPENESWSDADLSVYLFEVLTSDAGLNRVLAAWGIEATQANLTIASDTVGQASLETWRYRTLDGAELTFRVPHDQTSGLTYERTGHLWQGRDDAFARITATMADTNSDTFHVTGGTIQATGSTGLGAVIGVPAVVAYGASIASGSWTLQEAATFFAA